MRRMTDEAYKAWQDGRVQEARDIEAAKAELATKHGLERNAKFDRAWSIAWDLGHSAGIHEVKNYFHDLADLLKP